MQAGDLLGGKYALEARLGAGAMGEVWKARDEQLGRDVAIKILRPEHRSNRDVVSRFLREARAANLVRHANVVDVLDVGEGADGAPFLVQELLHGEDLGAHLAARGQGLSLDAATKILMPIVEAVAFAHGRGVVHRDLKPENVFLARSEGGVVPKLLDFGISHVVTEGAQRMTATGVALGTPAYMSPEQIKGTRSVDARSDVWSLGVLLHETLSGKLPFESESVGDLFVQIATADPIPLEVAAPHAPRAMCRIVTKCLKRLPGERYQDAGTLLLDLEAVASDARPSKAQIPLAMSAPRREAPTEARPLPPAPSEALPMTPAPARVAGPAGSEGFERRLVVSVVAAFAALAAAGLATSLDLWPDDLVLGPSVVHFTVGLGPSGARVAGGASLVFAVGAALQGWRRDPKSFGHLWTAAAALVVALLMAASAGGASATPMPWALAAASVGLGAICIRRAADCWLDELRGNSMAFGAVAGAAFVVARLLLRGAP